MIEIQNISRAWGTFQLRNISLSVAPGEYLVLLGPCGSGKTLLLETIAGLHTPDAGRVIIDGEDVTRRPPEKRRIGLVYQHYALFPHLSIRANIGYGLRYLGLNRSERRKRIQEMIELLGLHNLADRPDPRGLSGGEAQKIALARALAIHPRVLLLDEPFSSLDHQVRERIKATLPNIVRTRRIPVVHVTHDYTEAAALADRIAVFRNGRIIQTDPAETLFRRPANRFVAEFLGVENIVPAHVLRTEPRHTELQIGGRIFTADSPGTNWKCRTGQTVLACIRPEMIRIGLPNRPNANGAAALRELTDLGFHLRARIALDGLELTAFISPNHPAFPRLRIGAPVSLAVPPNGIHLLPPETNEDTPP